MPQGKMLGDFDKPGFLHQVSEHLRVLESLFQDSGLLRLRARCPSHPAVRRFDLLQEWHRRNGRAAYEHTIATMLAVSSMAIDRSTWVSLERDGDVLGQLADEPRKKIRTRIEDSEDFGDMMAELFVWGWLNSHGHNAELLEAEGPDLHIHDPVETWAEVKHIRLGTPASPRIRKHIDAANSQIKVVSDSSGLAYIHVDRDGQQASLDERVPCDMEPYVAEARRRLSSSFARSIGRVILSWDEYRITGSALTTFHMSVTRRYVVLKHQSPRQSISGPDRSWGPGFITTASGQGGDLNPDSLTSFSASDIEVSHRFRAENEMSHGLYPQHAVEVWRDSDRSEVIELDGIRTHLRTRLVCASTHSYLILLVAYERHQERPCVDGGYYLYGPLTGLRRLASEPRKAFETLLLRYGVLWRVGPFVSILAESVRLRGAAARRSFLGTKRRLRRSAFTFYSVLLSPSIPPQPNTAGSTLST